MQVQSTSIRPAAIIHYSHTQGCISNPCLCIGWFNSLAGDLTILRDLAEEQSIFLSCFMWQCKCFQLEKPSLRLNPLRFAIKV